MVLPLELLTDGWVRAGNMKLTPLGSLIRTQGAAADVDGVVLGDAGELTATDPDPACEPQADTASPTAATPAAIHIRIATPYCS